MKKIKGISMTAAAAVLAAGMIFPAGAEEKERIEEVSLYLESAVTTGETDSIGSVSIELETAGCYIDEDETKFLNEPEDGWDDDDEPKLRIVVRAEDGYGFASGLGESDIYLDEDYAEITSVSRTSSRVTIQVTLPPVGETSIYEDEDFSLDIDSESLAWDSSGAGIAYWDGNDYARYYEVRLFCDGEEVENSLRKTEDTYYDLSGSFAGEGSYTFQVRAVWNGSEEGGWEESEVYYVTGEEAANVRQESSAANGTWIQDQNGYWWCRTNRTWPSNQWEQIGGAWYWFNEGGYRLENQWILVGEKHYYLGENGVMKANTRTPDGYWVGADGAWDGAPAE